MPKTALPLNEVQVRSAKRGTKNRTLIDGRGLMLLIKTTGKKYWRFRYTFQGHRNQISIGKYPDISLSTARETCLELNYLVSSGVDPVLSRQAASASKIAAAKNSFEAIAREWHLRFKSTWSESHAKIIIRRLENDAFPSIGRLAIESIEAPKLLEVLREVEGRGAIETAHRLLVIFGQIFRYATQTGRAKYDVASGLRGAIPPAEERHLAAITDPDSLGAFLRTADQYHGGLLVKCAMRLTPILAVRPGELRQMEWSDIDLEKAEWRYTVSKTKRQMIFPLPRQAVAILNELLPITGHGKFVFPSPRHLDGGRPMTENAVLVAIRSLGYTKDELTPHGFRATFRTLGAEELGFRIDLLEHQLGHAVRDPLGRAYNRTEFLKERIEMMQRWADYLDTLRNNAISP